jgi:predicted nucleotidyltransferase
MLANQRQLPQSYQDNLARAVEILKAGGCTEVYLFGSLALGNFHERSDIDLAVRGCPPGNFFHCLGQLMMKLDYPVDLVDLDVENAFTRYLVKKGKLQPLV